MNADQVVEKILADAKAQADQIAKEAQATLDQDQKAFDQQLSSFEEDTKAKAKAAAEDKKQRMMANARMAASKSKLVAKIALIDEVFNKAFDKLASLDNEKYSQLMESLLCKVVETGDAEVLAGSEEKVINADFIEQVNRKHGNEFKGKLSLSNKKADSKLGFILRRGSISTNVTVDVLLAQAREQLETEICQELFA